MTWNQDPRAVAVNTPDYQRDPTTKLLPPVPLLPLVFEEVQQQKIDVILICAEWKKAMWWPQLAALRTKWLQSNCHMQLIV